MCKFEVFISVVLFLFTRGRAKFKFGVFDKCQFYITFVHVFRLVLGSFYVNLVYFMFVLEKTGSNGVRGLFDASF